MGEIVDMILDGILDEQTGEYIGEAVGYPRTLNTYGKKGFKNRTLVVTPEDIEVKRIRKEIAIRIKQLISEGSNENFALNLARQEANKKYGKGWRNN